MLPFLLMAAQAGGIFADIFAQKSAKRSAKTATQMENSQIDLRMQQERLSFEEQGLASLENLREVMSSQRALFAAQGRVPGIGSTAAISNRAQNNFSKDERAQGLSLRFKEHLYKTQQHNNLAAMHSSNAKREAESFSKRVGMINFSGLSNLFGSNKQTGGGAASALSGFLNG